MLITRVQWRVSSVETDEEGGLCSARYQNGYMRQTQPLWYVGGWVGKGVCVRDRQEWITGKVGGSSMPCSKAGRQPPVNVCHLCAH